MSRRSLAPTGALTIVVMVLLLTQTCLAGQQAPKWTPARTVWGDPDLQGVYTSKDAAEKPCVVR